MFILLALDLVSRTNNQINKFSKVRVHGFLLIDANLFLLVNVHWQVVLSMRRAFYLKIVSEKFCTVFKFWFCNLRISYDVIHFRLQTAGFFYNNNNINCRAFWEFFFPPSAFCWFWTVKWLDALQIHFNDNNEKITCIFFFFLPGLNSTRWFVTSKIVILF